VNCYYFESKVDQGSAVANAHGKMRLKGKREDIIQACETAMQSGIQILAPECAVPLMTPLQNLQIIVDFAREAA
jgi:hypothetical protein